MKMLIIFIVFISMSLFSNSETLEIKLDLSFFEPVKHEIELEFDKKYDSINVIITNKLPGIAYQISINSVIQPIEYPSGYPSEIKKKDDSRNDEKDTLVSLNKLIFEFIDTLMKARNETVLESIKQYYLTKYSEYESKLNSVYKSLTTFKEIYSLKFSTGRILKIKLSRTNLEQQNRVSWEWEYKTPTLGKWFLTYGVGIPLNFGEPEYFSQKRIDTSDVYVIKKSKNSSNIRPLYRPMILFHWMPSSQNLETASCSITAGTNFLLNDEFSIFLGGSITFYQFLNVSCGICGIMTPKLNGIYERNQEINENLTQDQLSISKLMITCFLGVSFRFTENPFSK